MILSLSTVLLGCLLVYPAAAQLTVQQMLQTISQFSADFTYPTVNSIAYGLLPVHQSSAKLIDIAKSVLKPTIAVLPPI